MVDSNVSFMPSGLVDLLTIRELRDLIAFLQSEAGHEDNGQKQGAAPQQPLVRVVDLNIRKSTQLELCNGQRVEVKSSILFFIRACTGTHKLARTVLPYVDLSAIEYSPPFYNAFFFFCTHLTTGTVHTRRILLALLIVRTRTSHTQWFESSGFEFSVASVREWQCV